ncbi:MAG: cytidylate kinase-like family protein [Clostridiales bacterium]|nr:cytidylate kinase-like family protein [Clostridiales bacterium]
MKNYVITIARGYGSGGSHIAKRLSKDLNIPCYDEEILQMAADLSGINERFFYEANERIHKGAITINSSKGVYNGTLYHVDDKEFLSDENLFNYQAAVIKNLAMDGSTSCIIVGKAANYVLRSLKNVVKVNIQAPMEHCVFNIMDRLQKDEASAKDMIKKMNKYRSDYYKYYTGRKWLDPAEYDLSINTGALGEDYAAKLILQLVRDKGFLDDSSH